MRHAPVVALLTDFGLRDPYVGIMKGVVLSICPDARLVDLGHDIPPQDVGAASRTLLASAPYFPEGTIFAAVVDPGVGTDRAAVAVRAGGRFYVGPDNGLLGGLEIERAVRIENKAVILQPTSATFHGRDVFAPAAAHLARGVKLDFLGPRLESLRRGPALSVPRKVRGGLSGSIVAVDRFGNLITDIPADALPDAAAVRLGRRWIGIVRTYASVKPGELAAVAGSSGTLEIAQRNGDARAATGASVGAPVLVSTRGATP